MEKQRRAYLENIAPQDWEKTPASVKKLVEEMAQGVEKLEKQVSELQAVQQQLLEKVNHTSKNSSSPPSQDPPGFEKKQEKNNSFNNLPKKEVSNLKKELEKLKKYFNGVKEMKKIPDIIVIIDQKREIIANKEALSLNIPIISILDTNCDPSLATIPIPGNDDSVSSIKYIIKDLVDSICLEQQNSLKKNISIK